MDKRFEQMQQWLQTLPLLLQQACSRLEPASSDASFRRYFRLHCGDTSRIVMDAPPEHEDCRPFVKVDQQLQALGVRVPRIEAQDLTQGFLLLEDFGKETLADRLQQASEAEVDAFYRQALMILVNLQQKASPQITASLPQYDAALLQQEMALFTDWLLNQHLQISLNAQEQADWQQMTQLLTQNALQQPQTFVLRDYHSRNLMVLSDGSLGVIDFQDAVQGALTYDAISLLRDCYQRWPAEQVVEWQRFYFLALIESRTGHFEKKDWVSFQKMMDWMGMQRHLKAAGIFARLYHRDGKSGYLTDIPNTVQYLYEVGQQYHDFFPLVRLLENRVMPALELPHG